MVRFRLCLPVLLLLLFVRPALAQPSTARLELAPRGTIDTALLGANAFVNDLRFGSIRSQLREVREKLHIRHLRVLFNWDDRVQPDPNSEPNFSFYDEIVRNIPGRTDALVIMTGLPSWMSNSANWIDNNPRRTFVERWVKKVAERYGKRRRISSFQVWNEPNMESNPENTTLGLAGDSDNYIELMAYAAPVLRQAAPGKKIVAAATTAIAQDFPDTLNYNERLKQDGLEELIDVWAIHYYGTRYELLLLPLGLTEFLNSLSKPLWVTEIGAKGTTKQLSYMQRTLPLLKKEVPGIERAYIYQFTEATPAADTYGLRNLTPGKMLSDLYLWLRRRGRV